MKSDFIFQTADGKHFLCGCRVWHGKVQTRKTEDRESAQLFKKEFAAATYKKLKKNKWVVVKY